MESKLQKAFQIYKKLGWEKANVDNLLTLSIGTKEEQKTALEGLKKGDFGEFGQLDEHSYGYRSFVNEQEEKLGFYAVRLGVNTRRARELLRGKNNEENLILIRSRGEKFADAFIQEAYKRVRRVWEHSASDFAQTVITLVLKDGYEVPEHVDYIKDWAVCTAKLFGIPMHPAECGEINTFTLEDIEKTAEKHLDMALNANAPITGYLKDILPLLVERSFVSKEKAVAFCFEGLMNAIRPGDRRAIMNLIDQLDVKEEEYVRRTEAFIPLLSLGENAITKRIAPILIKHADDKLISEILIASLTVKAKNGKTLVLKSALLREAPKYVEGLAEWIYMLSVDEDKKISKLGMELMAKWQLSTDMAVEEGTKARGLWQETPRLWTCPKVEEEAYRGEELTEIVAVLNERRSTVHDLVTEKFLANVVKMAFLDENETRVSLAGMKSRDVFERYLNTWIEHKKSVRAWSIKNTLGFIDARDECVIWYLGKIPCILSAPSYEDLSVSMDDLVKRLLEYKENNVSVLEGDLLLALARLDINTRSKKLEAQIRNMDIEVVLENNEKLNKKVSEIVLTYIEEPFVESEQEEAIKTEWWFHKISEDIKIPESISIFPPRWEGYDYEAFSVFPSFGDIVLGQIRCNYYGDVHHELGLYMRQVARRKKPFSKGGAVNFFASQCELTPTAAEDAIEAVHEAWERGLLRPGVADVRLMNWDDSPPKKLAAYAKALECFIEEGMLSVVWSMLDDIISISIDEPRLLAGTADIARLIEKYLEEVKLAVEKNMTSGDVLNLYGVRKLANRRGQSSAVLTAKRIVADLPVIEIKEEFPDTVIDFDDVWVSKSEQPFIEDEADFSISIVEDEHQNKRFMVELVLKHEAEIVYQIVKDEWLFDIEHEHQCRAVKKEINEIGTFVEKEKVSFLHYDADKKSLISNDARDYEYKKHGRYEGECPPLTSSIITVFLLVTSQKGMGYYTEKLIHEGWINRQSLDFALKKLLENPEVNIGKMLNLLENDKSYLGRLYPILIQGIKASSNRVAIGEKVPRWLNRVLDCTLRYVAYIKEALKRELISKEDLRGLLILKNMRKKSTVKMKAEKLCELLEI